jgi:Holliday junction resolvase RusA-like endonuclease
VTFSCFVRGLPQPKGSKRPFIVKSKDSGKLRAVTVDDNKPTMRTWERAIQWVVQNEWQGPPLEGPVRLWLVFVFPRPKSAPKRQPPAWKDKKPDMDKLFRLVGDALTGIVYRDDAQIASAIIDKRYGDEAGVGIAVEPLVQPVLFPSFGGPPDVVEARRA